MRHSDLLQFTKFVLHTAGGLLCCTASSSITGGWAVLGGLTVSEYIAESRACMHAGRRNRLAICYMGSRADKVRNGPRTVFLSYCMCWMNIPHELYCHTYVCLHATALYRETVLCAFTVDIQCSSQVVIRPNLCETRSCGQLTNAVSNCRCQLHYQLPVAQVLAPKICKLAIFVFVLVFDEAARTCERFGLL